MYEIWKNQAINELKMYEARRMSIENITDQIRELEAELTSIKSIGADAVVVRGSGDRDGKHLNIIVSRDLLKENLEDAKKAVRRVEKGLSVLNDEERELLDRFFIRQGKETAFDIADELGIDRKTVYSRRHAALCKFTTAMYNGV